MEGYFTNQQTFSFFCFMGQGWHIFISSASTDNDKTKDFPLGRKQTMEKLKIRATINNEQKNIEDLGRIGDKCTH